MPAKDVRFSSDARDRTLPGVGFSRYGRRGLSPSKIAPIAASCYPLYSTRNHDRRERTHS